MKVTLHYVVTNNGDGSASVHFVKNEKEAEIYDNFLQEIKGDGWGEGECFSKTIEVDENGRQLTGLTDVKKEMEEFLEDDADYFSKEEKEQVKEYIKELNGK